MAYSKFIQRLISGEDLDVYGDGLQIRSNTFIGDIVGATRMAAQPIHDGEVLNICGDQPISLLAAISELADELGGYSKNQFPAKSGWRSSRYVGNKLPGKRNFRLVT